MKLSERCNLPIICLIDTPGAYPGIGAEERGQAQAIAENIRDMFNTLRKTKRNVLDDGMVIDHHNLGEQSSDKKEFKEEVKDFEQKIEEDLHN